VGLPIEWLQTHPKHPSAMSRSLTSSTGIRGARIGMGLLLLAGRPARAETRLSLTDAITVARQHRAEVGQAALDVQLARQGLLRAGLQRVRLTLEGRVSEQVDRLYVNAPSELCQSVEGLCQPATRARLFDLAANLSIPVWTGFGLEAGWSRARALERAAHAQQRAQLRALTLEVSRAYWSVRWAELQREAAGRALERRGAVASLIKARADAGIAPRPDLNRAEIAVLRQQAQVAEAEGRVAEAHAGLGAALEIEGPIILIDNPPPQGRPLPKLADMLATASRLRPELERARAEALAQRHRVSQIEGDFWPHLSLFGRAEARNEAFGVPQPNLIGYYSAGVTLSWLAFDSLTTFEAARSAELEQQKLSLEAQRMVHVIEAEVRAAHARLSGTLARQAPLEKARVLAEATVDLLRRRYQSGGALLLEVLAAQEELESVEASAIESAIAVAEAQAALDAAVGQR
jgi:outer membrane protein